MEPTPAPPNSRPAAVVGWLRRYGRWVLLAFGLAAVGGLVWHVGPAALWQTLVLAGPYVPFLVLFDAAWMVAEAAALLAFYGAPARRIPPRAFLRSMMVHYGTMLFLPVGRAGAEVARAAMLAPHVGKQRAAAGAAQLQSVVLVANAVVCVPSFAAVLHLRGELDLLGALLLGNIAVTAFLGGGLYLFLRRGSLGGWLGARFARMAQLGPEVDVVLRAAPRVPWLALSLATLGRSLQTVQYGFIVLAVGGELTALGALIAQGIHLVGAGLGDMVPNQVGITEGAYHLFADALGLGGTPEKALAIAIVARLVSLTLAGTCLVGLWLWPPKALMDRPEEPQHA